MSFRTTLNKVLVRLREDTISSDWSGVINDSTAVDDYQYEEFNSLNFYCYDLRVQFKQLS